MRVSSLLLVLLAAPGGQLATHLDRSTSLQRALAAGERHRYEMVLSEGVFARVVIEQHGIDLTVQVTAPDGVTLSVDGEARAEGVEEVHVVAALAGRYELAITPTALNVPPGAYHIRVADVRPAASDDRALDDARRLQVAGLRALRSGAYDEARRLLEEAIARAERVDGGEHPLLADLLYILSDYYEDKQDYATALAVAERSRAISERTRGEEHPHTVTMTRTLAFLHLQMNDVANARAFARRALDIAERTLPPDHLVIARCLLTMTQVTRDAAQAAPLLHRSLQIAERAGGPDHDLVANILNELALLYLDRKEYDRAKQSLVRSQGIYGRTGRTNSTLRIAGLNNLGMIARERKDYTQAEDYYGQAASIVERAFGPENPRLAIILNNVANIHRARGDYSKSLEAHLRVLSIAETTRGPNHPLTLLSLGNIAKTYAAQGSIAEAIHYQSRVDTVIERNLEINLAVGSERQKQAYLRSVAERTDRTISLHVALAPHDPEATMLAARVLLERKGRVLDALSGSFASLHERATADERALLQQYNETTAELARLVLDGPLKASFAEHRERVAALEGRRERLEEEISRRSAEFRAQSQPVTLAAVQAAIPPDTALVEFAVYRPFDPRAERNAEAYGEPRYVAYVLRRAGAIAWQDLGDARTIDRAVAGLRGALRDPLRADAQALAREVHSLVTKPLLPLAGRSARLLISPDGALNLVPFEALVDDRGRYLIERYAFTYLTSGRDLLRLAVPRASRNPPIAVAGPLFGEPERSRAADAGAAYFAPLNGTLEEARVIKALFPEVRTFVGRDATEGAIKKSSAPRILHVATHGFFREEPMAVSDGARQSGSGDGLAASVTGNPLLRSGLALAGANRQGGSVQDGILTALEASGLNLWGTKLVVLSACDTGVGAVRNGEGVYGLRRAFLLAGAESLVMSLWPVSDYSTRRLMASYYRNLKRGMGRGEALRAVQREMLRRNPDLHPFYWANFIQSGAWTTLRDAL